MASVLAQQTRTLCTSFQRIFLPYMNIAESGQSGMRAQQPHGKMLLLVDGVYKDISKQMRMDVMYKADRSSIYHRHIEHFFHISCWKYCF